MANSHLLLKWSADLGFERLTFQGGRCLKHIEINNEVANSLLRFKITVSSTYQQRIHILFTNSRFLFIFHFIQELGIYLQRMLDSDLRVTDQKSCSSDNGDSSSNSPVSSVTRHSFYHPGALLLSDEGVVFVGLLVGLTSVDFCFVLKDKLDEFDSGVSVHPT